MTNPLEPYNPNDPLGYGVAPTGNVEVPRRAAELEPQPIGQLQSTTIIAALTGVVSILASMGVKWGMTEDDKTKIAEGVLAFISLGSFIWAWIGRVRATKQVSATKLVTDASKTTLPLLLLFLCTGCIGNLKQSPLIQIYTAKSAVATAYDEFDSAVRAGTIKNPTILQSAYKLIPEINKTLADATLKAKAGDSIGYQFLWEQLQDKLTRFLRLQAPANREPTSLFLERSLCPLQHLLPSSSTPLLASWSFSRSSSTSRAAALSARNNRLSSIFICNGLRTA